MTASFDPPVNDGKVVDLLSGVSLVATPEELVRQRYLRILHHEYGYPLDVMRREVPIYHGRKEVTDATGSPVRADIVVYHNVVAAAARDQGQVLFIVECKAPTEKDGHNQLVSYLFNTSAEGGVWFNGSGDDFELRYFRIQQNPQRLESYIGIPRYGAAWDSVGRRRISELQRPKDIKGLLRRCHNKLHARGSGSDEEDLTLDMVRIIMAKARDEESTSDYGEFYCTAEEYKDAEKRALVAARVRKLFEEVRTENRDVFNPHEQIRVGDDAICDVVIELQEYRLLSNLYESHDWDLMGAAYEQYTEVSMKRQRGQFFTNRLVVEFMVSLADPGPDDVILDPAGGSGGFLTGSMRHVRRKVLSSAASDSAKQRLIDKHRAKLYMVEQSARLVKIAKTAMILNGDGHAGMTVGNSLGPYSKFDSTIQGKASRGVPTLILTNPPFAGVGEGRITQADILKSFATGFRWEPDGEDYLKGLELLPGGAPPELLFFERSLDWLAPGGTLGIVMPKSFLDTQIYRSARSLLFSRAQLLAVVNCHKDTFQPHTGVRTCIVFLRKLREKETLPEDYDVFMGVSRKIGQDSEGRPIFKRDDQGREMDEIDHDLDSLLDAYRALQSGTFTPSQYAFSIKRSEIDSQLRINPQLFLPHLNATLERVTEMDGVDGWSVTTLGQLVAETRIFKGPRWRSSDMVTEEPDENSVRYLTPTAVLQENADSAKWFDVTHAGSAREAIIDLLRVEEGDILITRSGSNGRMAYVGPSLAGSVVSDDMIRVRIPDENMRYYVFHFLKSRFAQDQMARNEYGSVQQHLEPQHIRDILVPVPDDQETFEAIVTAARASVQAREAYLTNNALAQELLAAAIESAATAGEAEDETTDEPVNPEAETVSAD